MTRRIMLGLLLLGFSGCADVFVKPGVSQEQLLADYQECIWEAGWSPNENTAFIPMPMGNREVWVAPLGIGKANMGARDICMKYKGYRKE